MFQNEYYLWLDGSSTFWLRDESADTQIQRPLEFERAIVLPHVLMVKSTRFVNTRVEIQIHDEPLVSSNELWDKVLSGTLSLPSGKLVLEGLGYEDDIHHIDIKPGVYSVNVYYATLAALSESEIEEELESFRFEFYKIA